MTTALRTRFLLPLGLALAAWLPGLALADATHGSGHIVSESRSVGEFQAIACKGGFDLDVRQGPAPSVVVHADDNLLPLLETVVEPGTQGPVLKLRWKSGERLSMRSRARVEIVTPRLTALASTGSGNATITGLVTPKLDISLAGSGDARLEGLQADELGVRIAGSGDVRGSGKAGRITASIAGSGDLKLGELRAEAVTIRIAGAGDADVWADKTLAVTIAGSGDVVYRGEGVVTSSIAGSGSVRKR